MSDPRQLLDAYAAEYQVTRGQREAHAPEAFAALRGVLDVHQRDTDGYGCCAHDDLPWPCRTVRAITSALEAP